MLISGWSVAEQQACHKQLHAWVVNGCWQSLLNWSYAQCAGATPWSDSSSSWGPEPGWVQWPLGNDTEVRKKFYELSNVLWSRVQTYIDAASGTMHHRSGVVLFYWPLGVWIWLAIICSRIAHVFSAKLTCTLYCWQCIIAYAQLLLLNVTIAPDHQNMCVGTWTPQTSNRLTIALVSFGCVLIVTSTVLYLMQQMCVALQPQIAYILQNFSPLGQWPLCASWQLLDYQIR